MSCTHQKCSARLLLFLIKFCMPFEELIIIHAFVKETLRTDFKNPVGDCLHELMVMGCEKHGSLKCLYTLVHSCYCFEVQMVCRVI